VGVSYSVPDTHEHDRTIAELRGRLEAGRFGVAWEAGQAMTLDEAIAEALSPIAVETGSDGGAIHH
jgi:hypothetical protein